MQFLIDTGMLIEHRMILQDLVSPPKNTPALSVASFAAGGERRTTGPAPTRLAV